MHGKKRIVTASGTYSVSDTDGDGVPDSGESITQQIIPEGMSETTLREEGVVPSLSITGKGDLGQQLRIKNVSCNRIYEDAEYVVGHPYDFYHEGEVLFEEALLTFRIDEALLEERSMEDLAVAWYDEETKQLELQETTFDREQRTISAEVTHFSIYMVVDESAYLEKLEREYIRQQSAYADYNGHTYLLVDKYMTPEEAAEYCEAMGGEPCSCGYGGRTGIY